MADTLELVGKQVLGVQVVRRLARGSWSEVYQGEHLSLGRPVALKVYLPGSPPTDDALRRFIANADRWTALEHANLVAYLDAGRHEEAKVIVQAYVDGETLAARLKRQGFLEPAAAAAVFRDVARGLEAIHGTGMGHGDLKPENVLLTKMGDARVCDFGIARAVPEADGVPGTAEYLAPEWSPEPNPPGDIWAFGVLMYRALAGRLPFEGSAEEAVKAARAQAQVPLAQVNAAVPARIAALVERCLDKNPGLRPVAGECAFELDLAGRELRGEVIPGEAAPPPPPAAAPDAPPAEAAAAPAAAPMWTLPDTPRLDVPSPDLQPAADAVQEVRQAQQRREDGKTGKKRNPGYVPAAPLPDPVQPGSAGRVSGAAIAPLPKPTQSYGGFKPKRESKIPRILAVLVLVGAAGGAGYWGWQRVEPMLKAQQAAGSGNAGAGPVAPLPGVPTPLEQAKADLGKGRFGAAVLKLEGMLKAKEDREATAVLLEAGRKHAQATAPGMVFVPGGRQPLGGEGARAWVPSFLLDAREVTVEEYAKFLAHVAENGHDGCNVEEPKSKEHAPPGFKVTPEGKGLPVTHVDWWDAYAYAAWAQKRLPSEAEWERAATWSLEGPQSYPWGKEWKAGAANVGEGDASVKAAAAGSFRDDRTACWAEDMGGNVSEWCYDWFGTLPSPDAKLDVWWGPASGAKKVVRGPSWTSSKLESSLWRRWGHGAAERSDAIGFRCAMELKRE